MFFTKVMTIFSILATVSTTSYALSSFGSTRIQSKTIEESYKVFGGAKFENVVLKQSLKVFGPCKLFDSEVKGTLTLQGELQARNSTLSHLKAQGEVDLRETTAKGAEIQGHLRLKKSVISGRLNLMGYLDADESEIDEIKISTNEMKLKDTKVKSIFVRKNHADAKTGAAQQIIYLLGKTTIAERIVFENGNGLVVVGKRVKKMPIVEGGRVHASL